MFFPQAIWRKSHPKSQQKSLGLCPAARPLGDSYRINQVVFAVTRPFDQSASPYSPLIQLNLQ